MGKNNPKYTHTVMDFMSAVTSQKRNLECIVGSSLKTSIQCSAAVKKANKMLSIIKKAI